MQSWNRGRIRRARDILSEACETPGQCGRNLSRSRNWNASSEPRDVAKGKNKTKLYENRQASPISLPKWWTESGDIPVSDMGGSLGSGRNPAHVTAGVGAVKTNPVSASLTMRCNIHATSRARKNTHHCSKRVLPPGAWQMLPPMERSPYLTLTVHGILRLVSTACRTGSLL